MAAINKRSFVAYESFYKMFMAVKAYHGKEAASDFAQAIFEYGLYDEEPDEDSIIWAQGFEAIVTGIKNAKDRYGAATDDGKKGGRKKMFDDNVIAELRAQGYTNKKIAEELGCSLSTVEKANARLRKKP